MEEVMVQNEDLITHLQNKKYPGPEKRHVCNDNATQLIQIIPLLH